MRGGEQMRVEGCGLLITGHTLVDVDTLLTVCGAD